MVPARDDFLVLKIIAYLAPVVSPLMRRRLLSRLPLARQLLRFGDLRGGHVLCGYVSIFSRILVALRR
jgi:hypothetical protein